MSSPTVGDVLTTAEQLDACPEGTIVRNNNFWVFVRDVTGEWGVTGAQRSRTSDEVLDAFDGVTVIWVPTITRIEFEAVVQDFGCDGVVRPSVMRDGLGGGPWDDLAPLVGSRVRVTVERIGDDHD